MADLKKTAAEMADEARLKREMLLLEEAELNLEATRETVNQRKQAKARKRELDTMSQAQMAAAIRQSKEIIKACRHRQGGEGGNPYRGKGPTALKREKHPDGFTTLIRCLICPLRIASPIPTDRSPKQKPGETAAERDRRVAKYEADLELFNKYNKMAEENALSTDAAQPMDSGMSFTFRDGDGVQIYKKRPYDTYAVNQ